MYCLVVRFLLQNNHFRKHLKNTNLNIVVLFFMPAVTLCTVNGMYKM